MAVRADNARRFLVAADMEGVAGISDYRECLPSHPRAYARGRRLMTDEVLVAVEALRSTGAEVVVGDWHMVGTNVERGRMPAGVEVLPIAALALDEERPSMAKAGGGARLDGVALLGHHARTPSRRGFCSHTFVWDLEVELDGESLSETQVYAQALAAEGTPVLALSGDRWLLEEMSEGELGGAPAIETKTGRGRDRADAREAAAALAELDTALRASLATELAPPPPRTFPASLRVSLAGEELARVPVAEPTDLLPAIATVFRAGAVSREYRQLAKLLPSEHGSRLAALRRRAGGAIATPAMLAKERAWLRRSPA